MLKIKNTINKYYRKPYIFISFLSMCLLTLCFCTPSDDDDKFKKILRNVKDALEQIHYQPRPIDNDFSHGVFNRYFNDIDGSKRYFSATDMDHFNKDFDNLDDYFNNQDLAFYNATVDTLYKRTDQLSIICDDLLKEPFDYTQQEVLNFNEKEITNAKDLKEWKSLWSKHLKYNILSEIQSIKNDKESKDKDKSFAELEIIARKEVKENTFDFFRRFKAKKKKDFFSIYVNAFTEQYDPHTAYFSPKEKDDFDFQISGQLEGVGARLQDKKGYATIDELIIGGPAWKSGKIEKGDQILKVAQKDEPPVNIVGMLLDDAIRLIRGKKGTKVTLTIKKKEGSVVEIPIIRDKIEYGETFAKSAIITDKKGDKYGVIYLPEFYFDIKNEKGRSCSQDILKEITELKKEKIKGLILDVRNDGGGSLSEVIKIVGSFIKTGPVVQVRRNDGKQDIQADDNKTIDWDGPLVVMINELSASASEILAAALQDYKRAVIVGSNQSYGKGTVQTVIPLDRITYSTEDYGALKLTIQKFYRINGGSTQMNGVNADIVMSDRYTYVDDLLEKFQKTALPWDKIAPLKYEEWDKKINYQIIKSNSQKRLANNMYTKTLEEGAKWYKSIIDNKKVKLDYLSYSKEIEANKEQSKKYDSVNKYKNTLTISSPAYEIPLVKIDTVLKTKREIWHKNLSRDYYLEESINVLRDLR